MSQYKSIGIIGGMGPAATCDLFLKIINSTAAPSDQSHIHVYIDNNTNILDRTAAIKGLGESPAPELVKSAVKLQAMGADALIMPCNTAHYFYDQIVPYIDIPLIHMPRETAAYLHTKGYKKVGILATDGTIDSGVYHNALKEYGIEPVCPSAENQKVIMSLIYDYVKKNILQKDKLPVEAVMKVVEEVRSMGAEVCLMACTELPIAFQVMEATEGMVDPTQVLAEAAVKFAGAPLISHLK